MYVCIPFGIGARVRDCKRGDKWTMQRKSFYFREKRKTSTHTKMKNSKPKNGTESEKKGKRSIYDGLVSESEMNVWHYIKK